MDQTAKKLIAIALGESYYESALKDALKLPGLNEEERMCIYRWLDGFHCGTDHVALQDIALKITTL